MYAAGNETFASGSELATFLADEDGAGESISGASVTLTMASAGFYKMFHPKSFNNNEIAIDIVTSLNA